MSVADEARDEAERRYSFTEGYERGVYLRRAFREGAEWQASRPFTEEDVEAAAEAVARRYGHEVDAGFRKDMRIALDAVTKRRQT